MSTVKFFEMVSVLTFHYVFAWKSLDQSLVSQLVLLTDRYY